MRGIKALEIQRRKMRKKVYCLPCIDRKLKRKPGVDATLPKLKTTQPNKTEFALLVMVNTIFFFELVLM